MSDAVINFTKLNTIDLCDLIHTEFDDIHEFIKTQPQCIINIKNGTEPKELDDIISKIDLNHYNPMINYTQMFLLSDIVFGDYIKSNYIENISLKVNFNSLEEFTTLVKSTDLVWDIHLESCDDKLPNDISSTFTKNTPFIHSSFDVNYDVILGKKQVKGYATFSVLKNKPRVELFEQLKKHSNCCYKISYNSCLYYNPSCIFSSNQCFSHSDKPCDKLNFDTTNHQRFVDKLSTSSTHRIIAGTIFGTLATALAYYYFNQTKH